MGMRNRQQWFIHLRARGLCEQVNTPHAPHLSLQCIHILDTACKVGLQVGFRFEWSAIRPPFVLLLLLLLLCAGIHAKGASERLLCQRDGLGWFKRELVQRYICGPKEM